MEASAAAAAAVDTTTGLRQRRGIVEDSNNQPQIIQQQAPPRPPVATQQAQQQQQQQQTQQQQQQQPPWRTSHVYCFVSAVLAILAIITSASSPVVARLAIRPFGSSSKFLQENSITSTSTGTIISSLTTSTGSGDGARNNFITDKNNNNNMEVQTTNPVPNSYVWDALDTELWRDFMGVIFAAGTPGRLLPWSTTVFGGSSDVEYQQQHSATVKQQQKQVEEEQQQPWPLRKLAFLVNNNNKEEASSKQQQQQQSNNDETDSLPSSSWWQTWLDPSLLSAKPSTITDLIDKVLTSTPRLLAIANLLLALTYQMHTAVADWFLGAGVYPPPGEWAMTGRERLGSFLVFKLLLISAVVAPDTLDLLILLSWYTLLSFLRSLAHLAAATTSHTTQSGQAPRAGVLQLLLVVLLSDFLAAAVCAALFTPAGPGMVILLTCDCALLAVEVLGHVLKHARQVIEDLHEHTIAEMEEQQLQIRARQRRLEEQQQQERTESTSHAGTALVVTPAAVATAVDDTNETLQSASTAATTNTATRQARVGTATTEDWDLILDLSLDDGEEDGDDGILTLPRNNQHLLMEDSRRLDQSMDDLELAQTRRLRILDTTIFGLQLSVHAITVMHFLHIWTLHGIQFTLIDGVLALHLHSAVSAAVKQIAERRNLHRIARNLDGMFANASELDLKKAHACGDVCCICLGTMSVGSVKKVGCGHLYHTNCLREVVERAHSMEAAKCPLCRASVVDGSRPGTNATSNAANPADGPAGENNNGDTNNNANNNNNGGNMPDGPRMNHHRGERALFRFSTEGILPTWMPLPAFSFEVVRRPTPPRATEPATNNNNTANNIDNNNNAGDRMATGMAPANNDNINNAPVNNNHGRPSFFRRLLRLAGAVPLSPEEEARFLGQLVDMFPQYDRSDLLRELRDRGSAESVVESVLLGVFTGRVRGSAGGEATPARANNPAANDDVGVAEDAVADGGEQQVDTNDVVGPALEVAA